MTLADAPAHRVVAVVFDGMKMLDLAGPMEVFAEAARFGAHYDVQVRSVDGAAVTASTGLRVAVDGPAADAAAPDTLLVVGGDALPVAPVPLGLVPAVRALAAGAGRTASVCTGAFVLAAAGLLDGRRATTHWRHTSTLARAHPLVDVEPDAVWVRDDDVWTSAGVSAGIDLALALLESDHDPDLARQVARSLVVFLQRPGGQSQSSPSARLPRPRACLLRTITDAIAADPAGDHSLRAVAERAGLSTRHLVRLFTADLGMTPRQYVEAVRFDAAVRHLLEGRSVTAAAELSGIGSSETLRRVCQARTGTSPRAYQRRATTTGRGAS